MCPYSSGASSQAFPALSTAQTAAEGRNKACSNGNKSSTFHEYDLTTLKDLYFTKNLSYRYLHTRAGRRQSHPPGIRGTLGRNLKPRQGEEQVEVDHQGGGGLEVDHQGGGGRRPTVPSVLEETSSKSSSSQSEAEEEYSARKTVEREGRAVRRELRAGRSTGTRWSERGVDLPQREGNTLTNQQTARVDQARSNARKPRETKPQVEDYMQRKQKLHPTWSQQELEVTRPADDNKEVWSQPFKGWGEGGVWERARRGVSPTTSESSDSDEATFYPAVRREAPQSSGRGREGQLEGRERYGQSIEAKGGMRRGWTDEIEQGWRREKERTESLEKRKHNRSQRRLYEGSETTGGLLHLDAGSLGYHSSLGAVPRDRKTWRQPIEPDEGSYVPRVYKESKSKQEVDTRLSQDDHYTSNMERWRGQDLERENERERLRLGSGAVTSVYKDYHYSSRA